MSSKYETYNHLKKRFEDLETFSDLVGYSITKIERLDDVDGDELRFYISDSQYLKMYHHQDCCETVSIEDICGDLDDLLYHPILVAEERTGDIKETEYGDQMWTFYEFATNKGSVTIRWNGESNGYYSIAVSTEYVDSRSDDV